MTGKKIIATISTGFCLVFAGCGSSSNTAGPVTTTDIGDDPILLSEFEQFDTGQYPVEAPDDRAAVEHDVPASLLAGNADAGLAQEVAGYRIQVFASTDRDAALQYEENVHVWWENLDPEIKAELRAPDTLPVYNQFKQPLYRIRVGDFTLRSQAEEIMAQMASSFETVFVVPDQVTVYR